MKYAGKTALYKFLKEHGYDVPKMKDMRYEKYRGTEWLKYWQLELYSPFRGLIFVFVTHKNDDGITEEIERSNYKNGKLVYQIKNGKCTIMFGKPYQKVVV